MASKEKECIPEFGARQESIDYIDRPGVYAVIESTNKQIAIIETSNGYFLPGGGIDKGESAADALEREIEEEIGYDSTVLIEVGNAVEYIKANSDEKHYRIYSRFYTVQLGPKAREGNEKDHRLVWLWQEDAVKLLTRQSQAWVVQSMAKK